MPLGARVRSLAGRHERRLCELYRAFFVDVVRCTEQISRAIAPGADVIDVGGGDGQVLNHLLRLRPDISVHMLDLRPSIGLFLDGDVRGRVRLHPETSLSQYALRSGDNADVLLISDVVHHIPVNGRSDFFREAGSILNERGTLIVKDIAPGSMVSMLARLTDIHITGDRHVSQLGPDAMIELVESSTTLRFSSSLLARREHPNYAIAFQRG